MWNEAGQAGFLRTTLSILLLLACLCASTEAASRVRVAYLVVGADDATNRNNLNGFIEGMEQLGWKPGRDVELDVQFADDSGEKLAAAARRIIEARPQVIVSVGPAPSDALKKLAVPIPVVFVVVADPLGMGLANSLGRPGGNFTGLATLASTEFIQKQVQLLHEAEPHARRIAFLTNPSNPVHRLGRELRLEAARRNGLEAIEVSASNERELKMAIEEAARGKAELMYVSGDSMAVAHRELIAREALRNRIATGFLFDSHVTAGGLMAYGPDVRHLHRRAATYVDRILKGQRPADLAIEQPTEFRLTLNRRTARELGITFPPSLEMSASAVVD